MDISLADKIAFVAAAVLPMFNIPLIVRIVKRKSSQDISLWWLFGVWTCIGAMLPSSLHSQDAIWRFFNINNICLFSAVVFTTVKYRKGEPRGAA